MIKLYRYIWLALLCTTLCSLFTIRGAESNQSQAEPQLVDVKANIVYPYKINDTTSVLCLVGEFAAQHNGAVITADSAVRYENDRLECFGNVLINKNTTYAYADKAVYDSGSNTASLYSPLIKLIDEDVTMYAYNFSFNTLTNVGYYWGGGISTKLGEDGESKEAMMESLRGYYNADNKQVIGVDEVELEGESYLMKGDSMIYSMELDRAHFFTNTNIWNEEKDYLFGDRGFYDKENQLYRVSRNGYLLTKEQEMWGDSLEYYREREMVIMRSNIQIDDTTNKTLAFGDFGQYWGDKERMLLTRRATLVSYNEEQSPQSDSLFLSGDTILMVTYTIDEGPAAELRQSNSDAHNALLAELLGIVDLPAEEDMDDEPQPKERPEEWVDDFPFDESAPFAEFDVIDARIYEEFRKPTAKEIKAEQRAQAKKIKAQERAEKESLRLEAERVREHRRLVDRASQVEKRLEKRREKGRNIYADSMVLLRLQQEILAYNPPEEIIDTTEVTPLEIVIAEEEEIIEDSLYRVVTVFPNARSFREDMQTRSDSLIAISYDTTMQLHIYPLVWSGSNQISANEIYLYTKDGSLDYADMNGDPIMSSQLLPDDTVHFNQISGRVMKATFENNTISRNDVDGNVETVYFMQDEETGEPHTVANIESGSASFFILDQQLDGVIYRSDPNYIFAPLDGVPAEASLYLSRFEWCADLRPSRETIFDREVRPSQRKEKSSLEVPQFPIERKIAAERRRLVKEGEWQDREDMVSPEATEWMVSLGFTPGEPRADGDFADFF